MRAALVIVASFVVGGISLACGALTGVDWDRVKVGGEGGGGTSGTSGGGTSGGGTSGGPGPTGNCSDGQVECLAESGVACCPPPPDPGLPVAIAAGPSNTCAITETGQIRCWGTNGNGQLGRGSLPFIINTNLPLLVFRIPKGATQLTIGNGHICAIVDARLVCWGGNQAGQLGDNTTTPAPLPIIIPLSAPPDSVGAGGSTTCASVGGTGYCWGANAALQAGNDVAQSNVLAPKAVKDLPSLEGVAGAIRAGAEHSCAVAANSKFYCWGSNSSNRLGVDIVQQSAAAVAVINGTGPGSNIAIGQTHACALSGNGVKCWGSNIFGELGNSSVNILSVGAVTPTGLGAAVTSLCTGNGHTCVVTAGLVKCFGDNSQGQSGIPAGLARDPTLVQNMSGFIAKQVACGPYHTCALSVEGKIKCWGTNLQGERGDGTSDGNSSTPRDVQW